MNWTELETVWAPRLLSVLRIMAALLFLQHGLEKFVGVPSAGRPMPEALSFFWFGGLIELVGGILLAIGLFSRAAAFVMSGEMAVAYFMFHAPDGFFPLENGGDAAILYCFVFLYIVFAGPGPWSLDAMRGATRTRP